MAELQTEQPKLNPSCNPQGFFPPYTSPIPPWSMAGDHGHVVALELYITAAGYHNRGTGQPPPPGDELQSNKPRSSQQEGFIPTINQEAQTAPFPAGLAESEAEIGVQGSWGFMGGSRPRWESWVPWHPSVPVPLHSSARDVVATPLLPIQPLWEGTRQG